MTPNVPLLRKVLEHIEAHPQEWEQSEWRCETGMCFAGTCVDILGAKWAYPADINDTDLAALIEWDGERRTCWDVARSELGLTDDQVGRLFRAENTLDDLRRYVAALESGAL